MLFPAVRHELSFWHGARRRAGDLVLPAVAGPHPVVLLVGEPGATQRDRSAWLDGLAASGIACFTWDRDTVADDARDTVGRVSDRAREVLAALDRLRCLPEIDGDAVALLGWGEGGWAAAQAATFSSQVRALVLAGTPTAPPVAQVEHEVVQRLRAAGHTGCRVAEAREAVRRRMAGLDAFAEVVPSPLRDPFPLVDPDLTVGVVVDPLPTLSAVRVPVLALFGEQDPTIPLEESVRGVRDALRQAGHTDHRVAVVRGGDHGLRVRPRHGLGQMIDGRHQFGEWPAGLTQVVVEWLDERIRPLDDVPAYAPPGADGEADVEARGGVHGDAHADPAPGGPLGPSAADEPARPAAGAGPSRCDAADGGTHLPVRQVRRRITR